MTLITSTDRTVPVTVQTRSTLGPQDAFRLSVPIDLASTAAPSPCLYSHRRREALQP